jgi:hypothetical protein
LPGTTVGNRGGQIRKGKIGRQGQDADTLRVGLNAFLFLKCLGAPLRMALEIGQKVKVCRIKDRVSNDIAGRLGQVGTIKQYKMVDGSDVGVVVEFSDRFRTWFFEDELKQV